VSESELAQELLTALREVPGVRPATPATVPAASWVPWDWDLLAVDIDDDRVRIRLVATRLPLPPLFADAGEALRRVLVANGRATARLCLEITDLDGAAFRDGA
jgi:hypothetical protein